MNGVFVWFMGFRLDRGSLTTRASGGKTCQFIPRLLRACTAADALCDDIKNNGSCACGFRGLMEK